MLVSIKSKLAYLAMPKTGSTSVQAALQPRCELVFDRDPVIKHTHLRKYRRFIVPYLRSFGVHGVETVCVVREPVDWLRSWYGYRQRKGLVGRPNSTRNMDFAAFVEAWLIEKPPVFARVGRQFDFVADGDGKPGVDHIFRHDDMAGLAGFLAERTGAPIEFDQLNVSPRVEAHLPAALRARLERERPEEFTLYEDLSRRRAA